MTSIREAINVRHEEGDAIMTAKVATIEEELISQGDTCVHTAKEVWNSTGGGQLGCPHALDGREPAVGDSARGAQCNERAPTMVFLDSA